MPCGLESAIRYGVAWCGVSCGVALCRVSGGLVWYAVVLHCVLLCRVSDGVCGSGSGGGGKGASARASCVKLM